MCTFRDLIANLGGRRFLLCVGSAAICTYLIINGHISESIYRDLIVATVAVYIAGNTAQKLKGDNGPTNGN